MATSISGVVPATAPRTRARKPPRGLARPLLSCRGSLHHDPGRSIIMRSPLTKSVIRYAALVAGAGVLSTLAVQQIGCSSSPPSGDGAGSGLGESASDNV